MSVVEKFEAIHLEAVQAAQEAADKFFQERMNGRDQYAAGWAWVELPYVKGNSNTALGRKLTELGYRAIDEGSGWRINNPAGHPTKNVDTKFHGAYAYARVLAKYGIEAYAMDSLG